MKNALQHLLLSFLFIFITSCSNTVITGNQNADGLLTTPYFDNVIINGLLEKPEVKPVRLNNGEDGIIIFDWIDHESADTHVIFTMQSSTLVANDPDVCPDKIFQQVVAQAPGISGLNKDLVIFPRAEIEPIFEPQGDCFYEVTAKAVIIENGVIISDSAFSAVNFNQTFVFSPSVEIAVPAPSLVFNGLDVNNLGVEFADLSLQWSFDASSVGLGSANMVFQIETANPSAQCPQVNDTDQLSFNLSGGQMNLQLSARAHLLDDYVSGCQYKITAFADLFTGDQSPLSLPVFFTYEGNDAITVPAPTLTFNGLDINNVGVEFADLSIEWFFDSSVVGAGQASFIFEVSAANPSAQCPQVNDVDVMNMNMNGGVINVQLPARSHLNDTYVPGCEYRVMVRVELFSGDHSEFSIPRFFTYQSQSDNNTILAPNLLQATPLSGQSSALALDVDWTDASGELAEIWVDLHSMNPSSECPDIQLFEKAALVTGQSTVELFESDALANAGLCDYQVIARAVYVDANGQVLQDQNGQAIVSDFSNPLLFSYISDITGLLFAPDFNIGGFGTNNIGVPIMGGMFTWSYTSGLSGPGSLVFTASTVNPSPSCPEVNDAGALGIHLHGNNGTYALNWQISLYDTYFDGCTYAVVSHSQMNTGERSEDSEPRFFTYDSSTQTGSVL